MPSTTVTPASAAAARTAVAKGPSRGSATVSRRPVLKAFIVASGNTTRSAPASAARTMTSFAAPRFSCGSADNSIWASAMRM